MARIELLMLLAAVTLSVEGIRLNVPRLSKHTSRLRGTIKDPRCQEDGIFAIPEDCTSYLVCKGDRSQVRKCPEGMKFDSIKHCTTRDADCGRRKLKKSFGADLECPEDFGMFRYPGDCRKFMICIDGVPHERRCPPYQVYQSHIGCIEGNVCPDPPESYELTQTDNPPPFCKLPAETGPCRARFTKYYYDEERGTCKKFIYGGCGGNDNRFDLKDTCLQTCKRDRTDGDIKVADSCQGDELLPNSEDCNRFYECSNGIRRTMSCPAGLHFSNSSLRCETPCSAKCDSDISCLMDGTKCDLESCFRCPEQNGKFSDLYDCSIYHECKDNIPTVRSCKKGEYFDHYTAQCVKEANALCVFFCEEADGMFPHPKNCERFIECKRWKPRVRKCPTHKAFDPLKRECVAIEETNCLKNSLLQIMYSSVEV